MFPSRLSPGQVIGGDFRIVQLLGEGGMGSVYVAEQTSTGARRAVKVMQANVVADAGLRERFVQEARIGARIQSDHVVQVVGAGVDPQLGIPWLAMELLQGRELAQVLAQRPLGLPEMREVFAQLCHAVGAAHAAGVVHRDLKPENIFLADSRTQGHSFTVKVLDFGIAKILDMARSRATGAMGSQLWMAPEQTQMSERVSPATDVWALGLIAFYALTSRHYWLSAGSEAGTAALLRDILIEPLVAPSLRASQLGVPFPLPPGIDGWFARCVNREPSVRFANGADCCASLLPILDAAIEASGRTSGGFGAQLGAQGTLGASPITAHHDSAFRSMAPAPTPVPATYNPGPSQSGGGYGAVQLSGQYSSGHTSAPYPMLGPAMQPNAPMGYTALGAIPPAPATVPGGPSGTGPGAVVTLPGRRTNKRRKSPPWLLIGGAVALLGVGGAFGVRALMSTDAGAKTKKKTKAKEPDPAQRDCLAAARASNLQPEGVTACEKACDADATYCRQLGDLRTRAGGADPASLTKLYAKACEARDEAACQRQLVRDERGGLAPDSLLAIHQKHCDDGRAEGCTRAGDIQERRRDRNGAAQAADLYGKGCDGGDPLGCANLGMMLDVGRRVKRSPEKATAAFNKAIADKGGSPAIEAACAETPGLECIALGWMQENGRGFAKDPLKASSAYERACNAGILEGCTNLAVLYAIGEGVNRDAARRDELLKRACDGGEPTACTNSGVIKAGIHAAIRTNVRGVTVFKFACEDVLNVGCSGWGKRFEVAMGAAPAREESRKLLQKACDAGEQNGCVNLGALSRYGLGGPLDPERAYQLFEGACKSGNAGGCGEFGTMLWLGKGVKRDRTEADRLLVQACDWGEADSCIVRASNLLARPDTANAAFGELDKLCTAGIGQGCDALAGAYFRGQGAPKDEIKGTELQRRACEGTNLDEKASYSCVSLAVNQMDGRGVAKNEAQGAQTLKGLCDRGQKLACEYYGWAQIAGRGVSASPAEGLARFEGLCRDGWASGCGSAATALFGKKNAGDDRRGFELSQRGCTLGDANSCSIAADASLNGRGTIVDKDRARKMFRDACLDEIQFACQQAAKLGG